MADSGKHLSPKKCTFVLALMSERDIRAAAKRANIPERTAYRWTRDPDVQHAVYEAEADALADVERGLIRLAAEAVRVLGDAMGNTPPAPVAIRAADIVLTRLLQVRDLVNHEQRLCELERAQREKGRSPDHGAQHY